MSTPVLAQRPALSLPSVNIFPTDYCNRRCDFCMLRGALTDAKHRTDMTLDDINKILDVCERSGISGVKILGGEPSCHPRIVRIIRLIYARGLQVQHFFTNGIFDNPPLIDELLRRRIGVVVNYRPASSYSPGALALVHRNMRALFCGPHRCGPVGRSVYQHQPAALSITFYRPGQPYQYIIDAAKRFKADLIRFSTARSSADGSNRHLDWQGLKKTMPLLMRFVRSASRAGLAVQNDCCLAPCLFSKRDFVFFASAAAPVRFSCTPVLDVFPDLSVHYCMGMPVVSRLSEDRTFQDIYLEQLALTERLRWYPASAACSRCQWRAQRICQGYCLLCKRKAQ